jgi:glycosyltransferase involved in cell wall biosynthesis
MPSQRFDGAESLTVVVPVLNEAAGLEKLIARLAPVLEASGCTWNILFVDDGSTDNTLGLLRALNQREPRITAISLSRNFGKELAVAAGLRHSHASATVTMDGDLQHPPEAITEFVLKWREGYDVVYGQRVSRKDRIGWRRVGTRVFYWILDHLSSTDVLGDATDFRLFSSKAKDALNLIGERKRYNKGLFTWIGFSAAAVPIDVPERQDDDGSRWQPVRLLRFALDGIISFSTIPLRVWTVLGLFVSAIAFLYMLIVLFNTFMFGDPVRGYPTLMVTVLFFAGIQLISLGVIGEYLSRVYEEVKARPLYLVSEKIGLESGSPSAAFET